MDNGKNRLKDLVVAFAATVAIIVISKILTNTVLGTGFLAGGSAGASISVMALPLDAMMQALPVMAVLYLLPALIVLRPNKVKPLLGKKVI